MTRWYLIHSKPSCEAVARTHLMRQGFEVYLPRVVCKRRRRGIACESVLPLFPRYLFLRVIEGSQSLAPVRSSVGVAAVVRFGSRYAIVADRVVSDLRAREAPGTGLHRLSADSPLIAGSTVRMTAGPFDGLEGIFEREAGAERVVVLLRILGQDAHVRVPAAAIEPCAA
jgi:transcriptional antiterminator RfaH